MLDKHFITKLNNLNKHFYIIVSFFLLQHKPHLLFPHINPATVKYTTSGSPITDRGYRGIFKGPKHSSMVFKFNHPNY